MRLEGSSAHDQHPSRTRIGPSSLAYAGRPLGPALAVVDAVRANTVPMLRLTPDAEWKRSGTHTESGAYSAEDWLRIYAAHCHGHAEQVERVVAAWRAQAGERA